MSIWGRGLRPLSVCCVSLLRGRGLRPLSVCCVSLLRGRGLRPLSVCCVSLLRGRGLRPPGPVVAPLVPRYALLPAPSPWVRAEPRRVAVTHLCGCCATPPWLLRQPISACTRCGCRIGPSSGGRGGKERVARNERSSDWPRGAEPPAPEQSMSTAPAPE